LKIMIKSWSEYLKKTGLMVTVVKDNW
jgi:hypothetical protein